MTENKRVYTEAAKQALADMPKIVTQMQKLTKQLDELQTELNHLRMIAAYGSKEESGGVPPPPPVQGDLILPDGTRKPKGMAKHHIIDVLSNVGNLTAHDLRVEIAKKHGISYGISTIYANLSRGKDTGEFQQVENERWRIVK